jgi:predicted alpha/beta-hydrolase family hydrolase
MSGRPWSTLTHMSASVLKTEALELNVPDSIRVSAEIVAPSASRACYVFAHGAGAGMNHPSMTSVARGLADFGIATLRFQFPYMERGSKRPDPPPLCHATIRAAVESAASRFPGTPLIAGGRSFGGRMTSQAQALQPLPGVRGLVFLGFPLHPAGKPDTTRADHLADVELPMLFVQGTRDELATRSLLEPIVKTLRPRATVHWLEDADHSFRVPARTGRKAPEVLAEALHAVSAWVDRLLT